MRSFDYVFQRASGSREMVERENGEGEYVLCEDAEAQERRLRVALERIAAQRERAPREFSDGCCGHTGDAHDHGFGIGEWAMVKMARAALAGDEAPAAQGEG